ncbi:hypothetical protein N8085_06055 [Salibacteraceae bacterium]|jgi:hypothetical protein|nr:hypothetical protein [Crocinitomicaceae bacterium]MCH9822842.1 hypothetical protein [Bacteroidota bacterium]MDA7730498.1 hypothetical protein [Salibacteraceae bacterium]MDA9968300.1 hypothetical protein [Salibacteraceae bacterium]MDB0058260.1 hypothetical protein [Salibacteraceae bacterium]|tara:strand:- start:47553 stop:47939 length:387 start_codon:yes stop_codon:yes gene_type:complete
MRLIIKILLTLATVFTFTNGIAQVNLEPLEKKGFEVKSKLKPYKKTNNQVLKLKIKNSTEKNQELNFQLYLYVDGKAESMSEQKSVCLAPNKKVKYRFLFEPENSGEFTVELEKLNVKEVDSCPSAGE